MTVSPTQSDVTKGQRLHIDEIKRRVRIDLRQYGLRSEGEITATNLYLLVPVGNFNKPLGY